MKANISETMCFMLRILLEEIQQVYLLKCCEKIQEIDS